MLLNFDPLRAIILRDRLLVLVPDGADSILADLDQRIRGGADEVINSIFGNYQEDEGSDVEEGNNPETRETEEKINQDSLNTENELLLQNNEGRKLDKVSASNRTLSTSAEAYETKEGQAAGISDNNTSTDVGPGGKTPSARKLGLPRSLSMNALGKINAESTQPLIPPPVAEVPNPNHANEEDSNSSYNADEDDEWDEMEGREWIDLPFELQCVDGVLFVVGTMLTIETQEIRKAAEGCIHKLLTHDSSGADGDHPLTSIRAVKDAVREMTSRVKGFVQSMTRILDEDEDMALMNLSRLLTHPHRFIQPVPQEVLEEESDEPELILEANLQIALTLLNSLDLIKGQIDTASELLDQKLDALRNRLLFANMLISICTLAVTVAAVVGSFFGMNITNPLEETPKAWSQVTFGSIAGCILLTFLILYLLVYSGTIPRSSFRGI
jgi:magnesium transporter